MQDTDENDNVNAYGYRYINSAGGVAIPPAYAYIHYFSEGLASVTRVEDRFERFITAGGDAAFEG